MIKFKIGLAVGLWAVLLVLVLGYAPRTEGKRIDCSQADYHPDYTDEMREQCRLMRSGRLL